jgi:UDP-glucuronate decarboxylase
MRLMATSDDITGPMNLGNPVEFTMLQLAEKVIELTGSSSKLERRPLPSDDPKQRQPDISFARKTIDWEPGIPLERGLIKTIAYFKDLLAL